MEMHETCPLSLFDLVITHLFLFTHFIKQVKSGGLVTCV